MASYSTYNDPQLTALLKNSDHRAFTEIYHRCWKPMLSFAIGKSFGGYHNAEEIVQRVSVNLWNRRETLDIKYSLYTYLAAAVRFELIDLAAEYLKFTPLSAADARPTQEDASAKLDLKDLESRLAHIIDVLPARSKLVFRLSREEKYTYKQIAAELGVSEKAVEGHISIALRRLRAGLSNFLLSLLL